MESESKSQSLFDILENNKKLQCHQVAKQQDIDTDAESLMGDVTEKQQITMAIPQVKRNSSKCLIDNGDFECEPRNNNGKC